MSLKQTTSSILIIETDVELPAKRVNIIGEAIRQLARSQVGASFFCPEQLCKSAGSLGARANDIHGAGWSSIRKFEGGYRIWKIAEPKR